MVTNPFRDSRPELIRTMSAARFRHNPRGFVRETPVVLGQLLDDDAFAAVTRDLLRRSSFTKRSRCVP